jgi:stage II sporulation protein AA (anti-sigma F factor antagonist)
MDLQPSQGRIGIPGQCSVVVETGMPEVTRPSEFGFAVHQDRKRVGRMNGELDVGVAGDVASVEELLDAGFGHVVMDIRELTFMDSAGVHMLISARQSAERRRSAVSLVRGPRNVQRILELTAADSLLSCVCTGTDG